MKVSIITPSFQQGPFIERTLQSVLDQDGAPIEYLVVDGGSTDGTVDILKKHGARIRWISERDHGQADAVNKGIQSTSGDIIGWLNSDDVYYPGAVRSAVEFFELNPNVDVVYGCGIHIDAHDQYINAYPTEPWDIERLKITCFLCQPAVFFRRSVVERGGSLDVKLQYCMDYEYWLRLGSSGIRFAYLQRVLAGTRLYADTKTLGARVKVHAEINDMLKRKFGRVPDRWIYNYAHAVMGEVSGTQARPKLLKFGLARETARAAIRWNRRISMDMLRTSARWLASSI